jgi:adenylylsulfate kinase-like enzyme
VNRQASKRPLVLIFMGVAGSGKATVAGNTQLSETPSKKRAISNW